MTICILKLEAGQTIPRPFSRASSVEEMVELVAVYLAVENAKALGLGFAGERAAAKDFQSQEKFITTKNVDSERPICATGKATFYAFREA